jgi:phage tail tape-measure protein
MELQRIPFRLFRVQCNGKQSLIGLIPTMGVPSFPQALTLKEAIALQGEKVDLTAILTAKPEGNSERQQTLVDNKTRKEVRGGHRQTPANRPRRVPPSAPNENTRSHAKYIGYTFSIVKQWQQ